MTSQIDEQVSNYISVRQENIKTNCVEIYDGDLVVDDISSNRIVLSKMLKLLKVNVETAQNGLDALDKITKKNYKRIWMDVKMPLLNGIEVSEILRKQFDYGGAICAVTAYSDSVTHEECNKVGINDILTKPISINAVKQMAKSLSEKQVS